MPARDRHSTPDRPVTIPASPEAAALPRRAVAAPRRLRLAWCLNSRHLVAWLEGFAGLDRRERLLAHFALHAGPDEEEDEGARELLADGRTAVARIRESRMIAPNNDPARTLATFLRQSDELAATMGSDGRFDPQPILDLAAALAIAWEELPEEPDLDAIRRANARADRTTGTFRAALEADAPEALSNHAGAAETPPTAPKGNRAKEPSAIAIETYRMHIMTGLDQTALANRMKAEKGIPFDQSKVSRYLRAVERWLRDGNILPDLSAPKSKTTVMDPSKLEQGPRRDGRRGRG